MLKYLISLDMGGTKTAVSVLDTSDNSIASLQFDGANLSANGVEAVENAMITAINETCDAISMSKNEILGVVMGISGVDNAEDKTKLEPALLKLGIDRDKIFVCNDCELLMYSMADMPGICVVSGTGSVAYGYDDKLEVLRCGGHGVPLSDLGSGYFIGTQILKEYVKFIDDQIPYLAVFEEIEGHFGKTRQEMFKFIVNMSKKDIASVAKLVLDNAEDGDPLCEIIAKSAGFNLANLVATLYKKLDTYDAFKVDVCLVGSVFKNKFLRDFFKDQCKEQTTYANFNFVELNKDASEAGLEFAKTLFIK